MTQSFEQLTPDQQRRIDEQCDRFEKAVQSRTGLTIVDLLTGIVCDLERDVLLTELIKLALEAAKQHGIETDLERLQREMPDRQALIADVVQSWERQQTIHDDTASQDNGSSTQGSLSADPRSMPGTIDGDNRSFGHYRLLEHVGSGAFSQVWKAEDTRLGRIVALKIARDEIPDESDRRLFVKEARIAARLHHPGIVSIHEIGQIESRTYIDCEFIDGMTLVQWRETCPRSLIEVTQLFAGINEAVQYAHDQGIIHRDLKPNNILVDAAGQPHILDFGLAKARHAGGSITVDGRLVGTPAYMPPEQARGEARLVQASADVYALGAIFYELLTGERLFRGSMELVLHKILTVEPAPPRKLNAAIPIELESICLKCLAKLPEQRYASAADLLAELRRWQHGEPILARPITPFGRAWRWCRRNPAWTVASVLAAAVVLTLATVGPWLAARRSAQIRDEYQLRYVSDIVVARQALDSANLRRAREILSRYQPGSNRDYLRGFEWYYLWNQSSHLGQAMFTHGGRVNCLSVSPDGRLLASVGDQTLRVWNLVDRMMTQELRLETGERMTAVAFSPDGTTLATGSKTGVHLWDIQTGEIRRTYSGDDVWFMGFSADGSQLACSGYLQSDFRLIDVKSGDSTTIGNGADGHGRQIYGLDFAMRDDKVATASFDRTVKVWDLNTRTVTIELPEHRRWARRVRFAPDGTWLASSDTQAVHVWDGRTGQKLATLDFSGAESLAISPDSSLLASGSWKGTLRVWDVRSRQIVETLRGHSSMIHSIVFTPDGRLISSEVVDDGHIVVWSVTGEDANTLARHDAPVKSVCLSADGNMVAAASQDGVVSIWDTRQRRQLRQFRIFSPSQSLASAGAFLPEVAIIDSTDEVAVTNGSVVEFRSVSEGTISRQLGAGDSRLRCLRVFDHDRQLVAGNDDGGVWIWDLENGHAESFKAGADSILAVAISPDMSRIATATANEAVVWDRITHAEVYRCAGHELVVYDVEFSADGRLLATGSRDATVRLWDAHDGQPLRKLRLHGNYVPALTFSPTGHTLVTASMEIKLTDMQTQQEMITLFDETSFWYDLSFSRDGQTLAAAGDDNTVRLFRGPKSPSDVSN